MDGASGATPPIAYLEVNAYVPPITYLEDRRGQEDRPAPWHAGPHRPEAPARRRRQRLGADALYPGHLARNAGRQLRLTLPRAPATRGCRLRLGQVVGVREQPPCALLRADGRREEAARCR